MLGLKTDGTLWSWGTNDNGQLGQNSQTTYSSPVQIPGTTWDNVEITMGYHVVAHKTDGTLWCWGAGGNGQLGQNGPNVQKSSPTQVPGTWEKTLGAGGAATIALKN